MTGKSTRGVLIGLMLTIVACEPAREPAGRFVLVETVGSSPETVLGDPYKSLGACEAGATARLDLHEKYSRDHDSTIKHRSSSSLISTDWEPPGEKKFQVTRHYRVFCKRIV